MLQAACIASILACSNLDIYAYMYRSLHTLSIWREREGGRETERITYIDV